MCLTVSHVCINVMCLYPDAGITTLLQANVLELVYWCVLSHSDCMISQKRILHISINKIPFHMENLVGYRILDISLQSYNEYLKSSKTKYICRILFRLFYVFVVAILIRVLIIFLLTPGPNGYKPGYTGARRNRGSFHTGDLINHG